MRETYCNSGFLWCLTRLNLTTSERCSSRKCPNNGASLGWLGAIPIRFVPSAVSKTPNYSTCCVMHERGRGQRDVARANRSSGTGLSLCRSGHPGANHRCRARPGDRPPRRPEGAIGGDERRGGPLRAGPEFLARRTARGGQPGLPPRSRLRPAVHALRPAPLLRRCGQRRPVRLRQRRRNRLTAPTSTSGATKPTAAPGLPPLSPIISPPACATSYPRTAHQVGLPNRRKGVRRTLPIHQVDICTKRANRSRYIANRTLSS